MQIELAKSVADPALPQPPSLGNCENCGTQLVGKYCHACGKLAQGQPQHFHDVMSDVTDVFLNVDGRLFRSIAPLYLRPGKLTLDYFAGKRTQYLTPFRLVFFLAIVAFVTVQLILRFSPAATHEVRVTTPRIDGVAISTAPKPGVQQIDQFAHGNIAFGDYVLWNRQTKPVRVRWLPDAVDGWLNDRLGNAQQHLNAMNSGSYASKLKAGRTVILGTLSAAPVVLFLFLPLFALLLKIFYIFKKRLYMEHLIVAMYSHAFLMLSMLVLVLIGLVRSVFMPHAAWVGIPLALLEAAVWIWGLVYLYLMQKRVYRQGWIMTSLKYWCIGWCYLILVLIGWVFAMLVSLTGA